MTTILQEINLKNQHVKGTQELTVCPAIHKEYHIRRIVKEEDQLLFNIKIPFKFMDMAMFEKKKIYI